MHDAAIQCSSPDSRVSPLEIEQGLPGFIRETELRARRTVRDAGLDPEQEALLIAELPRSGGGGRPLSHLVAPLYLMVRAQGVTVESTASEVAGAFVMLQRFASLVDQVEDDELSGLPAEFGPTVTLNAAMTLAVLSLDSFNSLGLPALTTSVRNHLVRMSRGQHRELRHRFQLRSSAEARATAIDKSAEFSLLAECAAICAGCSAATITAYGEIGSDLALMVQIANDLSDIFGTQPSDDLQNGTVNLALAHFLELQDVDGRNAWMKRLQSPNAVIQRQLGNAMYESGTVAALAKVSDAARQRIHRRVALVCPDPSYAAMYLAWIDDLAVLVYRPAPVFGAPAIDAIAAMGLDPVDADLFKELLSSHAFDSTTRLS